MENQPISSSLSQTGLYLKYRIQHMDGSPMDPDALYFVLRYDEDSTWSRMGRETLWAMCKRIEKEAPALAADLRTKIIQLGFWRVFSNSTDTFVAMDWDDLQEVYRLHYDETMAGNGEDLDDWEEVPGDHPLEIWVDKDDYDPEDPHNPAGATTEQNGDLIYVTAKARDWAKANGRGFLCSTEF